MPEAGFQYAQVKELLPQWLLAAVSQKGLAMVGFWY